MKFLGQFGCQPIISTDFLAQMHSNFDKIDDFDEFGLKIICIVKVQLILQRA